MKTRISDAVRSFFQPKAQRNQFLRHLAQKRSSSMLSAALPGVATDDMLKMTESADRVLRGCLTTVRNKSRSLSTSNPYAKNYLRSVVRNVIGSDGLLFKSIVRDKNQNFDVQANQIIETAFVTWTKAKNCDVQRRYNLTELLRQIVRNKHMDGESFVMIVRDFTASKHRLALRIIDPVLVDETYWDDRLNIRCGIQFDAWGAPLNYFLRQNRGSDATILGTNGRHYRAIPADEMLHYFDREFPDQSRGIPPMHSAMIRLHHLGQYEEAEVMAARLGASKMGFFKSPTGDGGPMADGVDAYGNLTSSVSPGSIDVMPAGYEFQGFDPTHPGGNFGDFVKAMVRSFAVATGIGYNNLAGDYESVNYTSLRASAIEEHDGWKMTQSDVDNQILTPIFDAWIDCAFLVGALSPLPESKSEKFNAPYFHFRGFDWVDPQKDINASMDAIAAGLETATAVLARRGLNIEDVYETRAAEIKLEKKYGLKLVFGKSGAPAAVPLDPEKEDQNPGKKAKQTEEADPVEA